MLGRLFSKNPGADPAPAPEKPPSAPSNSANDTSYTREILYGVSDKKVVAPYKLNSKFFRVLVSQDGGNLRAKQVLFDSSSSVITSKPPSSTKLGSKNIFTPKVYHNVNELHDFMFGCGLPTNESQVVTKIHFLPPVNSQLYGNYKSALVTRLFAITDHDSTSADSAWAPQSALPIKHNRICVAPNSESDQGKNVLNSRFAIGLVIPIDDHNFTEIVTNNWEEISHYLIILQKVVHKKLINIINNNDSGNAYIISRRIQLPPSILQADVELNNYLIKLIKLIHYDSNIPRLINSNSLMRISLEDSSSKFNPMLVNWVLEVLNWLEFKESKQIDSQKFLASLFALIIPHRHALATKPLHYEKSPTSSKEITRVVVMTGNPVVAKKLLFIINGLIEDPVVFDTLNHKYEYDDSAIVDDDSLTDVDESDHETRTPNTLSSLGSPRITEHSLSGVNSSPVSPVVSTDIINEADDSDSDNDEEVTMSNFSAPSPAVTAAHIKPIPIKNANVGMSTSSSSDNSFNHPSSATGWEIPGKATPVAATSFSRSSNIPINNQSVHRASVSKSSSMAYLSSSLNSSSLSSSASNYSLANLGGSFMEKWRNSFNSSLNYEKPEFHAPGVSLSKKISKQTLRTPSPALEIEEFNWGNSPNINKLSRTQSMYDLYNSSFERADIRKSLGNIINRSKTSIYNNSRHNRDIIHNKCEKIVNAHIDLKQTGDTIEVGYTHKDDEQLNRATALLPNVAFCDEFRPEFLVQSCPLNPKLEQQVTAAMKNDLLFFQNNCGVQNITTRTILISLRAREIKLLEMKVGAEISSQPNSAPNSHPLTPAAGTSPINSYFSQVPASSAPSTPYEHFQRKSSTSYNTSIRKVFTPTKNSGDKEYIQVIENTLREMNNLFVTNYNKQHADGKLDANFTERLKSLVMNLA